MKDGAVTTPPGWKEAYHAWAQAGWNALPAPEAHGGQGLPLLLQSACTEMWNSAALAFALGPLLTVGAIEALEAHGSEHLKQTYLAKLVSGEWMGTMNLTEPQAGSDLNALRTKAERAGDGTYRITGQKIYITYGEHDMTENIVHLVLARLPDAPAGTRGISLFLVPKYLVNPDGTLGAHNDLRCSGIEHKLGIHASPTCSMAYGDAGRRDRLADRRGESRPRLHVHDDEQCPAQCGAAGRGDCRARLSAGAGLRPGAPAGHGTERPEGRCR